MKNSSLSEYKNLLIEKRNILSEIDEYLLSIDNNFMKNNDLAESVEQVEVEFHRIKMVDDELRKFDLTSDMRMNADFDGDVRKINEEISAVSENALNKMKVIISTALCEKNALREQLDSLSEARNISGYRPIITERPLYVDRRR